MTSIIDPRRIRPQADGWQRAQIASAEGRYGALKKATDQARRIEFGGPYQSECAAGGRYGALETALEDTRNEAVTDVGGVGGVALELLVEKAVLHQDAAEDQHRDDEHGNP